MNVLAEGKGKKSGNKKRGEGTDEEEKLY